MNDGRTPELGGGDARAAARTSQPPSVQDFFLTIQAAQGKTREYRTKIKKSKV